MRIRALGLDVGIEILRCRKSISDVGLRATGTGDRPDLGAEFVFVVQALVGGFGVEIDGAGAG